jgi:hypothetical protein
MRESSDIIPRIFIHCLTWIKVASCKLGPRYPRTERPVTARQEVWRTQKTVGAQWRKESQPSPARKHCLSSLITWSLCWLHDRCYRIWYRSVSCSIQAWGANALPRPVIGSPSLISNSYSGALFREIKRSGREIHHRRSSSRGLECQRILTYKPAYTGTSGYRWRAYNSLKHNGNYMYYLLSY